MQTRVTKDFLPPNAESTAVKRDVNGVRKKCNKMDILDKLSSCLQDIVTACIQAAASSGKKLSWTFKEDTRGVLVHLVWKPSKNTSCSPELVCSKWKPRKNSPSRQKNKSHAASEVPL